MAINLTSFRRVATGVVDLELSADGGRLLCFDEGNPQTTTDDRLLMVNLTTGVTRVVTSDASGQPVAGWHLPGDVATTGPKVAFASYAGGFVAGDGNGVADIFVKNMFTGKVVRASVAADGTGADGECRAPVLSADGSKVAFLSAASNLTPGGDADGGRFDLFVKDLATGAVRRVEAPASGPGDAAFAPTPEAYAFTPDGAALVVEVATWAADFGSYRTDIHRVDLATGAITLLVAAEEGLAFGGDLTRPKLSADGRSLLLRTEAGTVVAKDLVTGELTPVSADAAGDTAPYAGAFAHGFLGGDPTRALFAAPTGGDEGDALYLKDLDTGAVAALDLPDALRGVALGSATSIQGGAAVAFTVPAEGGSGHDLWFVSTGATDGADRMLVVGDEAGDAGRGNDLVEGSAFADRLDGGADNDRLRGGAGDDTYVFRGAFGVDDVRDTGGVDTLLFADRSFAEARFNVTGGTLAVRFADGALVRLADQYDAGTAARVEFAAFEDGRVSLRTAGDYDLIG